MKNRYLFAMAVLALLFSAVAVGACGGSDDSTESDSSAESADGTFIADMTLHHMSAIEMADLAAARAQNPEIKELADNIISSQGEEIAQMEEIHQRLFDAPVDEAAGDPAMAMSESDLAVLETAKPFDREFIDMMIPHHQEAIRMARVELADGEDEELKSIATAIIEAQTAEIEEMNSWRVKWYGAESPAGDVPAEDEAESGGEDSMDSMEGMEH